MTDSERLRSLLDAMADHEAKILEIKQEIAVILFGAPSANGTTGTAEARQEPSKAKKKKAKAEELKKTHGPVAKGTKGRKVIEIVDKLGGHARAPDIAEHLPGGVTPKTVKRARTHIYHLSREGTGYLEPAGEAGVWKLTDKAYEAMGKAPAELEKTPIAPIESTGDPEEGALM